MFEVSYTTLAKLEPLVEAAAKFESALHKSHKDQKEKNWFLSQAKAADLPIDERLLGTGKKNKKKEVKAPIDVFDEDEASDDDEEGARHKRK